MEAKLVLGVKAQTGQPGAVEVHKGERGNKAENWKVMMVKVIFHLFII